MLYKVKSYSIKKYCCLLTILFVCLLSLSPAYAVITFEKWYGGTGDDGGSSVAQTTDRGFIITGFTGSFGSGSGDVWLLKTDSLGDTLWTRTFGGSASDHGNSVQQTTDGGYIITGATISYGAGGIDIWLIKTDSLGDSLWTKTFGGTEQDLGHSVAQTIDGGYIITGSRQPNGSGTDSDYATVKYNTSGVEQWVARYNGPGNIWDKATAIGVDNSGNVYVTGHSLGSGTDSDYATVKYNTSGVEQWVARYNGPGNFDDVARSIAVDSSGHIYVTGMSCGSGTQADYGTVKYDSQGLELWAARYNATDNSWDDARAIVVDNTGNVYVTGHTLGITEADYATVKYDSSGAEQWAVLYNGSGNSYDYGRAITVDNIGNVYVTGDSWGNWYDYATIKYLSTCVEEILITQVNDNFFHKTIFRGALVLPQSKNYKVFDITGRVVLPGRIKPGIYFIEVNGKMTQKVIKVK